MYDLLKKLTPKHFSYNSTSDFTYNMGFWGWVLVAGVIVLIFIYVLVATSLG